MGEDRFQVVIRAIAQVTPRHDGRMWPDAHAARANDLNDLCLVKIRNTGRIRREVENATCTALAAGPNQLVIGTGAYGRLPVMEEVQREAERRKVELVVLATSQAIDVLKKNPEGTNAIPHVTC